MDLSFWHQLHGKMLYECCEPCSFQSLVCLYQLYVSLHPLVSSYLSVEILLHFPVLLEGSPGVGKTSLIIALGKFSGHRVVRINLSEQVGNFHSIKFQTFFNSYFCKSI